MLYNATDGPNWDDATGWATDEGDLAGWFGVTLDEETASFVSRVELPSNGLAGTPEHGSGRGFVLRGVLGLCVGSCAACVH